MLRRVVMLKLTDVSEVLHVSIMKARKMELQSTPETSVDFKREGAKHQKTVVNFKNSI